MGKESKKENRKPKFQSAERRNSPADRMAPLHIDNSPPSAEFFSESEIPPPPPPPLDSSSCISQSATSKNSKQPEALYFDSEEDLGVQIDIRSPLVSKKYETPVFDLTGKSTGRKFPFFSFREKQTPSDELHESKNENLRRDRSSDQDNLANTKSKLVHLLPSKNNPSVPESLQNANAGVEWISGINIRVDENDEENFMDTWRFRTHLHTVGLAKSTRTPLGLSNLHYTPLLIQDPRKMKLNLYGEHLKFWMPKFIVSVTMYNEEPEELIRTIRGICECIRAMTLKTADDELWRKFVCVITVDGKNVMSKKTIELMKNAGLISPNKMRMKENLENIGVHLFQTTAIFVDDPVDNLDFLPLQTMVVVKEKNSGKISSHWWLFEGFCDILCPKYVILLDVGTRPVRKAFYHIYRCFQRNSRIAAISGEMTTSEYGTVSTLVAAQHFEYKISTILDRAIESVSGYLSVLPGSFSAYRYETLRGDPLRVYFKTCEQNNLMSAFESNMYLVEDRLWCMELFTHKDNNYTLHWEREAISEMDVCMSISELMKQRRRWINGSSCALIDMIAKFPRILFHKHHSVLRKLLVLVDFIYYLILLASVWTSPFFYMLFLHINVLFMFESHPTFSLIARGILWTMFALQILCGVVGNVNKLKRFYTFSMYFFGVVFASLTIFVGYYTLTGIAGAPQLVVLLAFVINFSVYFLVGIIFGEFISVILSFWQWWFTLPTYSIILTTYALCNLHDVSWGTKNINVSAFNAEEKAQDLREQQTVRFKTFRNVVVSLWILTNFMGVKFGVESYRIMGSRAFLNGVFKILMIYFICFTLLRFAFSIIYAIMNFLNKRVEKHQNKVERAKNDTTSQLISEERRVSTRRNSVDVSSRKWKDYLILVILTAPIRRRTWIAFCNVFIFSPLFAFASVGIWSVTFSLSLISFFSPFSGYVTVFSAIVWRYFANLEFSYNSFDGSIAQSIGVDYTTKSGTGRYFCSEVLPSVQGEVKLGFFSSYQMMKVILGDSFTWKSFFYLIYVKPVTVILTLGYSLLFIGLTVALGVPGLAFDILPEVVRENFKLPQPVGLLLAILFFFITLQVLTHADKLSRVTTNYALGTPILSLGQKSKNLSGTKDEIELTTSAGMKTTPLTRKPFSP